MINTVSQKGEWRFPVENSFVRDSSLSVEARLLYIILKGYVGPDCALPFPKLATLARIMDRHRATVQIYLKELENAGWLARHSVKIAGQFSSTRYELATVGSFPRCGDSSLRENLPSKRGNQSEEELPISKERPSAVAVSSTLLRPQQPPPSQLQNCAPSAKISVTSAKSAKISKNTPSPEGLEEAGEFRKLLPDGMALPRNWQASWGAAFDALADDGRGEDEMWRVIRWARADTFWSAHVMSPVALRKRSNGVQLYDRLLAVMMSSTKRSVCAPRL